MTSLPCMPFWTDAYLADTRHLPDAAHHGAYLLLLFEAWRRPNHRLPDDDTLLAKLACVTPTEWATMKPVVMAFWKFDKKQKNFRQKRIEREANYISERRALQRQRAVRGWSKRKKTHDPAMPDGCTHQASGNAPIPIPIPIPIEGKKEGGDIYIQPMELTPREAEPAKTAPARSAEDIELERGWPEWYAAYPLKKAKAHALKSYRAARKAGAAPEELMSGLIEYKRTLANTGQSFIKHPATWLNGHCWLDEPAPVELMNGRDHSSRSASKYREYEIGTTESREIGSPIRRDE